MPTNDLVNVKRHSREKRLVAGRPIQVSAELFLSYLVTPVLACAPFGALLLDLFPILL